MEKKNGKETQSRHFYVPIPLIFLPCSKKRCLQATKKLKHRLTSYNQGAGTWVMSYWPQRRLTRTMSAALLSDLEENESSRRNGVAKWEKDNIYSILTPTVVISTLIKSYNFVRNEYNKNDFNYFKVYPRVYLNITILTKMNITNKNNCFKIK